MYWMDTLATDNYAAMITQFEFRANPGIFELVELRVPHHDRWLVRHHDPDEPTLSA